MGGGPCPIGENHTKPGSFKKTKGDLITRGKVSTTLSWWTEKEIEEKKEGGM